MNVHKMLNLFILIFLFINVVLFYYIDKQEAGAYSLTREREQQLSETFYANDLISYAFIPEYYPRPRLVVLSPKDIESKIVDIIFEDENPKMSLSASEHIHKTVDEELKFVQGKEKGRVFYMAKHPRYVPVVNDDKSNNDLVKQFVLDITGGEGSYRVTDTRTREDSEASDSTIYFFNESFEGELLFSNEVVVRLDEGVGITEARAIRYEPYLYEAEELPLVAVDEVLYNFMFWITEEAERQIIITDIDIGYYLGIDSEDTFVSRILDPHYRIKLNSGETYYVNAYTNELVK